jgi:hypothetical protein
MSVILQPWCQIQGTSCSLRYLDCGSGRIQCIYCSVYSGFNIQLDVSALLWETYRQFNVHYTANMVPNTALILQFTLHRLWSRTYTIYFQLHILRLQYSTKRSCAAIGDISTMQCALHCKLCAKYSAQPPDFAMCTVVPAIYSVITAQHIQDSIYS